ncbi:hypothetical protein K3G63_04620 [Hymenobacter sp. HSC-4F20]|uniref:hypothetical protein n=1 Tax=Hymenobacter sp. HSC-4F20 TaxID=2864135 RepID=UPI001C738837|nr:hypothetical protein [Hymenobacter sp. HSC-4F20]MBX0289707.1 hypothetical protein [Hymenobacter sp. HSC-4F20]
MTIATNWTKNRQAITGLDYTPIAAHLEAAEARRNPNDTSSNQHFLKTLFQATDQHEAGKQLPIFPKLALKN